MLKTLEAIVLLVVVVAQPLNSTGDEPETDQAEASRVRPVEVDAMIFEGRLNDLLSSPAQWSGHHIEKGMSPEQKIRQVYSRQMDVDEAVELERSLNETFPGLAKKLEDLFKRRYADRSSDVRQVERVAGEDAEEAGNALKAIAENEFARTLRLSQELKQMLTRDQREELATGLVRKFMFRALGFPFVASEFGLDEESAKKIQVHHDEFTQSYSLKRRNLPPASQARPFAKSIALLSYPQLVRYFRATGQYTEGMKGLDDVVDTFPQEARGLLAEVILDAKLRSEK